MPKLDTTIDNLERKSNKVTGTTPSSSWTDAQYPSAKTLYNAYNELLNLMHPVGSILTTSTNKNPSSTLGGTWELVDRSFKDTYIPLDTSYWTALNAEISDSSNILLTDHTVSIRLHLTASTVLDDNNTELGTLDLSSCGITELSHVVFYEPAISDLGNCVMSFKMLQNGTVSLHEVINVNGTHAAAAGSDFFINIVQPIRYYKILDDFCDKFSWKRTA